MVKGGHVWQREACMVKGGMCGEGGWGVCGKGGVCVAKGGMHGERGACVAKGGMHGMHTPPPPLLRDTAGQCVGGMHPTGMHSC